MAYSHQCERVASFKQEAFLADLRQIDLLSSLFYLIEILLVLIFYCMIHVLQSVHSVHIKARSQCGDFSHAGSITSIQFGRTASNMHVLDLTDSVDTSTTRRFNTYTI